MATTTAEQVCNLALLRIGERQFINNLNEASAPARMCKVIFEPARNAVLEAFPWPFAEREEALALLSDATATGWEYVYVLPADCARAEYLNTGSRPVQAAARPPFKLALGNDTLGKPTIRTLCADEEDAVLVYTCRLETVALWSASFVDALAWKMAADLALGLSAKAALARPLMDQYRAALLQAGAVAFNQAQDDQPAASELISSRE